MKPRFSFPRSAPGVYTAMEPLDHYIDACGLDATLLHLARLRASQLNGCAYCIDMHWKDLRALGETEQRLYSLDAWRECPWFSDRERAALAWTDALTLVASDQVPDAVYEGVKPHFTEKELADLTCAIVTINAWNRISIASRLTPGSYHSTLSSAN